MNPSYMIKKKIIILSVILFQLNLLFSQTFKSNYRKISTEDGLSEVAVRALIQDKNGFIWAGTEDGLNRFDGDEFIVFRNIPTDSTSLSDSTVLDLVEDDDGNIWVATGAGGICKYDPCTNLFERYISAADEKSRLSDNVIFTIYKDNENRIWAGNRKGLDLYNKNSNKFEPVKIDDQVDPAGTVYDITSDKNGLWLATGSGVKFLNTNTFEIEKVYQNNPLDENSLSLNFVRRIALDKNGLLWIVLADFGVNRINTGTDEVKRYFQQTDTNNAYANPHVKYILPDKSGDIWLATEIYGLIKFNPATETLQYPDSKPVTDNKFSDYQAATIIKDNDGSIWVGSVGKGIILYNSSANSFEYKKNLFTSPYDSRTDGISTIFEDIDGGLWLNSEKKGLLKVNLGSGKIEDFQPILNYLKVDKILVHDIVQDSNKYIWIATRINGIIRINPETNDFKVYFNKLGQENPISTNSFYLITETQDGKVWFASVGILTSFDPKTEELKTYKFNPKDSKALPGTIISALKEDFNNDLWIGFFSSGLFKLNRKTDSFEKVNYEIGNNFVSGPIQITCLFQKSREILWIGTAQGLFRYNITKDEAKLYTRKDGLANNRVYNIIKDELNNLWISTTNGISKFNPKTEVFINYNAKDGLQQSEYQYQSSQVGLKTGLMYFGGTKGFNYFDPKDIKVNKNVPPIVFSEFKKYDKKGNEELVPGINYIKSIELPYEKRDFSVKIAALDYTNPSKNQYAYWLEGYNSNWIKIDTRREINFTNLSPGNYTLNVKGSNNDGIWNEKGRSLKISILPPWWSTWWAYTLYAIVLIALFYVAYKYRINQLETVRLKELDEAKRKMYTNITHEFRTPLTIISGITKELRAKSGEDDLENLDLIDRSSKNMLYLVNQLLELRKLEAGKTGIDYIQGDIISYLKYVSQSFKTYAKTKNINLHFVSIAEEIVMDYDPDKLLMILSNLLSNAIKYSNPDGDVYLQVDEKESILQIRVVDSGKGIPEEQLPFIFDRFYKVKQKEEDNIDGVGIGLAVTKELTDILNGKINVTSKIGQGSIFTIELPIHNKAALSQFILPDFEIDNIPASPSGRALKTNKTRKESSDEEVLQLLVIEDNKDIIQYLTSFLGKHWDLSIATNGHKGIEKALENVPDIILCDLMMPEANGYQVLDTLKNDAKTSHIPIVILTAKADDESRIKAYEKGADAYLLKPFNKEELLIVLKKLAEHRRMLQERYQTQASLRFAEGVEIHKEDTFIEKLEQLVLSENSKSSYSITSLCEELGMSRTQLHNKIKALTGKSTSIFIRSLRLQKGKYMLEHTSKGISEIAYDVGFNNPSYFTKSFTEEFGFPPSSLRK